MVLTFNLIPLHHLLHLVNCNNTLITCEELLKRNITKAWKKRDRKVLGWKKRGVLKKKEATEGRMKEKVVEELLKGAFLQWKVVPQELQTWMDTRNKLQVEVCNGVIS